MISKIKSFLRETFYKNKKTQNIYRWISRCLTFAMRIIPDKQYLQVHYWATVGKKLNLDNPVTFNEKMQWLKK
jgi:hypothetical protein